MAITIYFIAISLLDRLASVRDALLLKNPSELTIEVFELALKDVESNLRLVASASGAVSPPLFLGCTVPQLPTFTASLATSATDVTAAAVTTSSRCRGRSGRRGGQGASGGGGGDVASGGGGGAGAGGAPPAGGGAAAWYLNQRQHQQQQQPLPWQQPQRQQVLGQGSGQRQLQRGVVHPPCTYHVLTGARRGQPCGRSHPPGQGFAQLTDTVRLAYGVDGPARDWLPLVQTYDPTLWGMSASQLGDLLGTPHAMYAVVDSSASDSVYSSVVSLGASLAEVPVASVALHCFFRDRTTLTPLPTPVSVALADPTSGPVTARYTITLPCLAVPFGSLTGFHVPSFSRNLVGMRPLVSQHVGVWIEPSNKTAVCVDGDTYAPLATFTAEPGSGLYTLHAGPRGQQQLLPPTPVTVPRQVPASHQVAASPQVAMSGQVPLSGPVAASCSCRSLAHLTVLWHHQMGHSSISRLRAMSSQRLVLGLPRVLPSLPPSLAPPWSPYVEGRLRATPHSSSLRPATEPFETLHLDKSDVTSTLIWWLLTTVDTHGRHVKCLHSNRGGEFCSGVLAGFCHEQGIRQSWTLPESSQQNGVAEHCIGLVMETARTSMTHAHAPHFLWPYVVWYGAHQLNLWPRWHDTLRSTLSDLGFQPSSADPSLFVHHGSTPFFVLLYVDELVFVTADKVALADMKLELQKRHTCTDLGELGHYLGLQITRDTATRTITLSQSHMVQKVLQRFELHHSTVHRTPLAVDHRLTGPFPDEPFEPSGPYA
ncbi:unnamed protein product [Closterium sp. NIES-54]